MFFSMVMIFIFCKVISNFVCLSIVFCVLVICVDIFVFCVVVLEILIKYLVWVLI